MFVKSVQKSKHWSKKLVNKPKPLARLDYIKGAHLFEADHRYGKWRKDKVEVSPNFTPEEENAAVASRCIKLSI